MSRRRGNAKRPHRIIPVWHQEFDSRKLARALLLMAMHLDDDDKTIHTQAKQEGGEDHES